MNDERNNLFYSMPFPRPFSKETLLLKFQKMHAGDLMAREELIFHNLLLVKREVFGRFHSVPYDKEELFSVGMIGLIKSIDTFDWTRNTSFSAYSLVCIDNEILMFLRQNKRYHQMDSLDREIAVDAKGNEFYLKDFLRDETSDFVDDVENQQVYQIVRKLIAKLPQREQFIIEKYFGFQEDHAWNQKELAAYLGTTQSYISKITKNALLKIQRALIREHVYEQRTERQRVRKRLD